MYLFEWCIFSVPNLKERLGRRKRSFYVVIKYANSKLWIRDELSKQFMWTKGLGENIDT